MPVIVWDKTADRKYESGLDRGVLYLPNGAAVPWNGLVSIIESFDRETSPVYFDGMKISDLVTMGSFSASMTAVTYPDEFLELEGHAELRPGMLFGDQPPQSFGLCYRTKVGNPNSDEIHYKLHILYNLVAIPSDKAYASVSDDPSLVEFEWEITAVPEEVPGFRPTAHIIIDSSKFDPWLLSDLEERLYGSDREEAALLPMPMLVQFIEEWARVRIIDHGDGTWSAVTDREGFIFFPESTNTLFQLVRVNARFIDDDTYEISDTVDITDVPQLELIDNGNGTWTAMTSNDNVIVMTSETEFEIRNVHAIFQSDEIYRITDTTLVEET